MNNRILHVVLSCLLLSACASLAWGRPPAAAAAHRQIAAPWCVSTDDWKAQFLKDRLVKLITSSHPTYAQIRASLGQLPVGSASDVAMVGDEAVCQRASQALDSSFFQPPVASPVYVARVGTRYAIHPDDGRMGEFGFVIFTDSAFQYIGTTTF